ncbi:unnamed protein product [Linum trigynum]|uniref:DUF4283 domain-containing protein n=1 Tax=Linum trigynum TaxID=586398 RepID=A0AAV2G6P7_9ROSI
MAGPVVFNDEVLEAGQNRARLSLVGRLLCSSHPSRTRVQHTANNLWAKRAPVTVLDADHGLFQLVFSNATDRQEAPGKAPWFLHSKILTLKKWETPSEQVFQELARVPYLVQLWNLPEEYRTVALGRLLAAQLGTVVDAGMYAVWENPGCVFKARVLIDVSSPLQHRLEARKRNADGSLGEPFRVSLKYENIKTTCFRCRRIGHNQSFCSFDLVTGEDGFGPEIIGNRTGPKLNENSYATARKGGRNWGGNVWRHGARAAPYSRSNTMLIEAASRFGGENSVGRGQGLPPRDSRRERRGADRPVGQLAKMDGLGSSSGPEKLMGQPLNEDGCKEIENGPKDSEAAQIAQHLVLEPTPLQVQAPSPSYGLGNLYCSEDPGFLFDDLEDTLLFSMQGEGMGFFDNEGMDQSADTAISCSPIGCVADGKSKGKAILIESSESPRVYIRRNVGVCIQEPEEGVVNTLPKSPSEKDKVKGKRVEVANPNWPQNPK